MDIPITTLNVERVLDEFGRDFVALLRQKLEADGRKASGRLLDSLRTEIVASASGFKVFLESEDYLKYVDYGRKKGRRPPREKIRQWVADKNIVPTDERTRSLPREKQLDALSYVFSRSIGEKGTLKEFGYDGRGGLYTDRVLEELYPKYAPRLEEALWQDFGVTQNAILDEINKIIKI